MKWMTGILLILLYTSCSSNRAVVRQIQQFENNFQHHAGFVLYDPEKKEFLVKKNADKYFTPASNTKIITFFVASEILGESLPSLYYKQTNDSLIFWGTGSPALMYDLLPESPTYSFLKDAHQSLFFSPTNFYDQHFGAGWSWDDYLYTFSSEKSSLPIYGNAFTIKKKAGSPYLKVNLPYFQPYFTLGDSITVESRFIRSQESNLVIYEPSLTADAFSVDLPFRTDKYTIAALLADTLNKPVEIIHQALPETYQTLPGIPADSAYKVMMQQSDNFIAEQLLLTCAGQISDSLKTSTAIRWAQENLLKESPDHIIWKDGSGLSRYNLITPQSIVWLWEQLYDKLDRERLFSLIAVGGQSGTIKNYYRSDPPYIYGKTGTLSNNHNLSGFLRAKSGKILIFSFMNNNYPTESRPVKK
ncbi:MAG: D-alanyl-D-alanine carboxypeptidase, partial [Fulvivirga sp.]|nr:D-alanyl-D-alanine carboxypeptidase [Fulvivirga sp.]